MRNNSVLLISVLLAACGGGGGKSAPTPSPSPAPVPPPADTTPPQTTIDTQPAATTTSSSAVFTFSSDDTGATFQYSLDGGSYANAVSPLTLTAITDGAHTLSVRARDAAGNLDATPATAQWSVDASSPDSTITTHPDAATRATGAQFTFASSKPNSTFEVSLDDAAYAAATSPASFTALGEGTHTFRVRARDAQGVVDPTPATFSWAVDNTPPTARIVFPTAVSYTDADTITVRGHASDANGVTEVRVNGVLANTLDGFQNWRVDLPVNLGDNDYRVSATDTLGNAANGVSTATVANRGPQVSDIQAISFDPTGDRVIVRDGGDDALYAYDAVTGYGTRVSPASAAAAGSQLTEIAVDAPRNRVLMIDTGNDALVAADLATGARTEISPAARSTAATAFTTDAVLSVDAANVRAFVLLPGSGSIFSIDLATGVRSLVTGPTLGTGDPLLAARGLAFDDVTLLAGGRVLVSMGGDAGVDPQVVQVEMATGNRTPFSQFNAYGNGPEIQRPGAIYRDGTRGRLVVRDDLDTRLYAIDLLFGNRSDIAGPGPDSDKTPGGFAYRSGYGQVFVPNTLHGITRIGVSSGAGSVYGRSQLIDRSVGSGLAMNYPEGLIVEQGSAAAGTLLLADRGYGAVIRVNLATGKRTVLSSTHFTGAGTGPNIFDVGDLVLDTRPGVNGHKVIALVDSPLYSLVSIDLDSGNRTVLAPLNFSDFSAVGYSRSLRLDAEHNRVFFTVTISNGTKDSLYSVDLGSGTVTAISGPSRGSGHAFMRASSFVLEPGPNPTRALVTDEGPGGVYAIDLASGDRSEFIAPWAEDAHPGDSVMGASYLDAANGRLLGMRVGSASNLFSVSLATREQRLVSGEDPATQATRGRGPVPEGAFAMDVNDGVAYVANPWINSLFAIDLVSGDRVVIAH